MQALGRCHYYRLSSKVLREIESGASHRSELGIVTLLFGTGRPRAVSYPRLHS